jgi:hypothetical protein
MTAFDVNSKGIIDYSGVSTPEYCVNINGQGSGTLTGDNVDTILSSVKADWCADFTYQIWRKLNQNVSNTSTYGSGQLVAGVAKIVIYPTPASVYAETSLFQGTAIPTLNVYRTNDMNGKLTVTEEWDFSNVTFTAIELITQTGPNGEYLAKLVELSFQYQQIQHTFLSFNAQTYASIGNNVSLANFATGTLVPPAAGGGGGGDAGGGGGAPAGGGGDAGGGGGGTPA